MFDSFVTVEVGEAPGMVSLFLRDEDDMDRLAAAVSEARAKLAEVPNSARLGQPANESHPEDGSLSPPAATRADVCNQAAATRTSRSSALSSTGTDRASSATAGVL